MLLLVSGARKEFSNEIVLEDVTFRLDRRGEVALVGRNGTGKTTLLKMILGELLPDGGSIQLARGAKIGYLKQENQVDSGRTVVEEVERAAEARLELNRRLAELEERLEAGPTDDELNEYATLHEHHEELAGFSAERDVRTVLKRMGFDEDSYAKPAKALSGGEKTRLALAKLLLEEPDLLILDEPTNHLDLQATEWLEGWINQYPGAVLLVSHDRTFLERTAERFLHLEGGFVKSFPGPFSKYMQLREDDLEHQRIVAKKQEEAIAKLDEFVRRFMNSQRTAQARGRLKLMNRLIEGQTFAPDKERSMQAVVKAAKRSGDLVLEAKRLAMGYGDRTLFRDLSLTVGRGDKIGVIGSNGAGKSTLIKILLGAITPLEGSVRIGSNVEAGSFSQDTVNLDPEETPIDTLIDECGLLPQEARDLLGRFLLTGDDPFRKIKTLSGGEKNKVALAAISTMHPNLLVMDEPTNHLDMDSREALSEILRAYDGTLILISHDRWLLGQVTTKTWDLRDGKLIEFPGSYLEYVAFRNRPFETRSTSRNAKTEPMTKPDLSPRELSKEKARLAKLVEQLEAEVSSADARVAELEDELSRPPAPEDLQSVLSAHAAAQERARTVLHDWAETSEQLERLSAT